jgi:hypothetical protein
MVTKNILAMSGKNEGRSHREKHNRSNGKKGPAGFQARLRAAVLVPVSPRASAANAGAL